MVAFSEFILLTVAAGALSSWSQKTDDFESSTTQTDTAPTPALESKSLYDLLEHFPTDKDITCPGSDSRFRYPGECHRYVTCRNYEAHIHSCPPGMSFDLSHGQCRLSLEVDCEELSPSQPTCGPNEEYSSCKCERTCGNFENEDTCEDCSGGCFCRTGYVRDEEGSCVRQEECGKGNTLFFIFARF